MITSGVSAPQTQAARVLVPEKKAVEQEESECSSCCLLGTAAVVAALAADIIVPIFMVVNNPVDSTRYTIGMTWNVLNGVVLFSGAIVAIMSGLKQHGGVPTFHTRGYSPI